MFLFIGKLVKTRGVNKRGSKKTEFRRSGRSIRPRTGAECRGRSLTITSSLPDLARAVLRYRTTVALSRQGRAPRPRGTPRTVGNLGGALALDIIQCLLRLSLCKFLESRLHVASLENSLDRYSVFCLFEFSSAKNHDGRIR